MSETYIFLVNSVGFSGQTLVHTRRVTVRHKTKAFRLSCLLVSDVNIVLKKHCDENLHSRLMHDIEIKIWDLNLGLRYTRNFSATEIKGDRRNKTFTESDIDL